MKLAICGPGESGKDEVASWLHQHTTLRYSLGTSDVLVAEVARRLDLSIPETLARKSRDRELWADTGDELRARDPLHLIHQVLLDGDLVVGVRRRQEMLDLLGSGLVDLSLWVCPGGRPRRPDTTMGYGPELCDLILQNHWGLPELHWRLERLAGCWGVLRGR